MVIAMGAPPLAGVAEVSCLGAGFGLAVAPPVPAAAFAFDLILLRRFSGKGTSFAEDWETDKAYVEKKVSAPGSPEVPRPGALLAGPAATLLGNAAWIPRFMVTRPA